MEHDKCLKFLKESISRSNTEHIVVVTHHVPSFELLAPEFNGSPLNGAFTVELEMKKLFSIYEQKDLSEIKFHFGVPIGFVRDII